MWDRFTFIEQRETVCSSDRMYIRDSDLQVEIPQVSRGEERRRVAVARIFKEHLPGNSERRLPRR